MHVTGHILPYILLLSNNKDPKYILSSNIDSLDVVKKLLFHYLSSVIIRIVVVNKKALKEWKFNSFKIIYNRILFYSCLTNI